MKIKWNSKIVETKQTDFFGAEGEIHLLPANKDLCIKIFDPRKRTSYLEKKILTLIQRFAQLDLGRLADQIAFPQDIIYEARTGKFCGYVMKYFEGYKQISGLTYNYNSNDFSGSEYSEDSIIRIIDDLFYCLKGFHQAGIILGDLNPQNILVHGFNRPVFVDIDSAQVGTFRSNSQRSEYRDPNVQVDGYGASRHFVYSTDSDLYSMAIIAYELLMGSNPYYFQTSPPTDTLQKKRLNFSYLDCIYDSNVKDSMTKYQVEENVFYIAARQRFLMLENFYPLLTKFFKSVFIDNKRTYFRIRPSDTIEIKIKGFESINALEDILSSSKKDPIEFEEFVKQFQFQL